jgi:hypothetical protein
MAELIVNCKQSLSEAHARLDAAWERSKYIRVIIRERKRSLNQNDQAHVWYGQIAETLREDTTLGVKCESKLNVGVPLLCAYDPDFREFWHASMAWLTHEQKLEAMKYIPVTSAMPVDVASIYLENLKRYWLGRGIELKSLKEEKGAS